MEKYIDKELTLHTLCLHCALLCDCKMHCMEYRMLNSIPTSEVYPIRYGHWIQEEDRYFHWHCSECEYTISGGLKEFKYCPNCGAKMEVDE